MAIIGEALTKLRMEGWEVRERIEENYKAIYGDRAERLGGFRKSDKLTRFACTFAIVNVLNRLSMPRPPDHIAKLCGYPYERLAKLQKVEKTLSLSELELFRMKFEHYVLAAAAPEDYVDTICACIGIPYHVAGSIYANVLRVKSRLFGTPPPTIAATVICDTLRKLEERRKLCEKERKRLESLICEEFGINPASLIFKKLKRALAELDLEEDRWTINQLKDEIRLVGTATVSERTREEVEALIIAKLKIVSIGPDIPRLFRHAWEEYESEVGVAKTQPPSGRRGPLHSSLSSQLSGHGHQSGRGCREGGESGNGSRQSC